MVQRRGHYDRMNKNDWKHFRCGYGEVWSVKNGQTKKKFSCARKSGRKKNNAGTDREEINKLAGPLVKKELPDEGCSRSNGKRKKVRGRRRYLMIENIMKNEMYADKKRKAEKRVGRRRKNNAGTDKEEEKKLARTLAKKELPAKRCSRRYGKWEESWRQKKISDDNNIMINVLYEDTKRKAEKRVEWRMLSVQ